MNFTPGQRVRYVGQITEHDVDAEVTGWEQDGKIALRLRNGAVFLADPADIRPHGAPVAWPMSFPESASL